MKIMHTRKEYDHGTKQDKKRRRAASGVEVSFYTTDMAGVRKDCKVDLERMEYELHNLREDVTDLRVDTSSRAILVNEMREERNAMFDQINFLTSVTVKQAKQIDILQNNVTDLQKRSMSNNVLIHNVAETKDEDATKLAYGIISKTGVQQEAIQIERAHRLGAKRPRGPRPIVCRISRQDYAYKIIESSKAQRSKI
jgi:hypothetical protein